MVTPNVKRDERPEKPRQDPSPKSVCCVTKSKVFNS